MEEKDDIWPPAPTTSQAEIHPALPKKTLNKVAWLIGLCVGLLYSAGVWCIAYSYARSAGLHWQMELPFELAVPVHSPEFIDGLTVGSLLLLLLLILLRRPWSDFDKGLAASYLPFGLLFAFVLLMYFILPKAPSVVF